MDEVSLYRSPTIHRHVGAAAVFGAIVRVSRGQTYSSRASLPAKPRGPSVIFMLIEELKHTAGAKKHSKKKNGFKLPPCSSTWAWDPGNRASNENLHASPVCVTFTPRGTSVLALARAKRR